MTLRHQLVRIAVGLPICIGFAAMMDMVLHRRVDPPDLMAKSLQIGCFFFVIWRLSTLSLDRRARHR